MKNATLGDWFYIGLGITMIMFLVYMYWWQYNKSNQRELAEK